MKKDKQTKSTTTVSTESRYLSRRKFLEKSSVAFTALLFGGSALLNQSALAQPGTVVGNTVTENEVKAALNKTFELNINFEIKSPNSGRGKKPYVAVWVEDWTGQSIRTLHLWMQQKNGEKYLPELKRWHRNDRKRKATTKPDIIKTISSPTKRPGTYSVLWDGTNDNGEFLDAGEYYICVESAREDGPYNLVRGRVNVGTSAFTETFIGNTELGDVHVDYRSI